MCDNSHLLIVLSPGGNSPKQGTDLIEPLADMAEMGFGVWDIYLVYILPHIAYMCIYIYIYMVRGMVQSLFEQNDRRRRRRTQLTTDRPLGYARGKKWA